MYIHRKTLDVRVSLPRSSPSRRFKSTSTAAAASAYSLRLDVWPHAATGRPWAACGGPLSRGIRPGLRSCFPLIIATRQRLDELLEPGSLRRSAAMSAVVSFSTTGKSVLKRSWLPVRGGTCDWSLTFLLWSLVPRRQSETLTSSFSLQKREFLNLAISFCNEILGVYGKMKTLQSTHS